MSNTDTQSEVYPSIQELLPDTLLSIIPAKLAQDITERYERLGPAYATENRFKDGRFINGMMYTNRVENAIEEIVDAVFCMAGWIFKAEARELEPPDSAFLALNALIDCYSLLMQERDNESA